MSDLIDRKAVIGLAKDICVPTKDGSKYRHRSIDPIDVMELPSAEPEEFEWCHDCKEYDQEQHCCHRWTKVIRQTIDEVKANAEMMKVTDTWKVAGCHELNAWCPNCEHRITRGCSYCPTCGVKLDWSERDE